MIFCISCGVYAGYIDKNIAFELMEQGKLDEFKKAIVADPQLVFSGAGQFSLLAVALIEKKYNYAKFLIERGGLCVAHEQGYNPLVWAIDTGNLDIVKYILARSDKVYLNKSDGNILQDLPLGTAVEYPDIVEFLLKVGANPEIKNGRGYCALGYALNAMYGCVDSYGQVFFSMSDYKKYKKSASLIFDAIKDKKKFIQEYWGVYNFLQYACSANNVVFVDYCLKNQLADVNDSLENGMTLLHFACYYQFSGTEMVDLLLKYGAKVNIKDKLGGTPLHHVAASEFENKDVVELLLKKNAAVNVIDNEGRTALDRAIETSKKTGNKEIVQLLRKYGAKTAKELQTMKNNPQKHAD